MFIKALILTALSTFLIAGSAFAFGNSAAGCTGDCVSCHPIKKEEFVKMFKKLDPESKVLDVQMAPVKGLYQITMETPKSKGIVYMDYGKKHIVSGSIIDISSKVNLTSVKRSQVTFKTIPVNKIPVKDAVILGNPRGNKTIYVFTDPDCPFCLKLHPEIKKLALEDKNLKIALILSPLPIHPEAGWKSQSIIDKSRRDMLGAVAMLEDNYTKKDLAKPKDATLPNVVTNRKATKDLGIKLLPSIVMPNGKMFEGYKSKEEIKLLLNQG